MDYFIEFVLSLDFIDEEDNLSLRETTYLMAAVSWLV